VRVGRRAGSAKDSLPATEKEVVREKVVREKELIREEK
jgi:hypothetical protein